MGEFYYEQFRRQGFRRPIWIVAGPSYLILRLAAIVLTACLSLYGILHEEPNAQDAGAFFLAVVCFAVVFMVPRFVRARTYGILVFSEKSVYNGLYGLDFAWDDLGPAWIVSKTIRGTEHKTIFILLRHAAVYRRQLPWHLRWQIRPAPYDTAPRPSGLDDMPGSHETLIRLRDERLAEGDTARLSTLPLQASGISAEQIVEIINRTVLERMG